MEPNHKQPDNRRPNSRRPGNRHRHAIAKFLFTPFVVALMPPAFLYICFKIAYNTLDFWFDDFFNG